MKNRLAVVVVASILVLGACTTVGNSPATAPPATAPPATEPPVTTSTSTATTTTTLATTTTLDRLEVRRLQAIMDQDEEAFRSVFANAEYEERSMVLLDEVTVIDPEAATFTVTKVFVDDSVCIAVEAVIDASRSIQDGGVGEASDYVVEKSDRDWGFSWVGSGWRCDGPHPFSD